MTLQAPPGVFGSHDERPCQKLRPPLVGPGVCRSRQESDGFIPGIAPYVPVAGRSSCPFTQGVNCLASTRDHKVQYDLGPRRGRPCLPPFVQRDYASFRELANFPGEPPCNRRGLFQPGY